ncbi:hypothetical protein EJ576_22365 [Pseudomonas sp. C 49-2]|uniref:dermonecrotic toxin domain-containing protein n=1 Tax=Pseudomonas TaxID=286 RepID=UPI000F831991|nr:DUF6543 domain-containing protein [Pseudomonas sp. C 49-2]RTX95639.1 hypothetical protein EJ576_22365 [Pseudomonas sp. C 49-2]
MPSSPPITAPDNLIAKTVGAQFIHHPTLISVTAQWLEKGIKEAYPTLDFNLVTTKLATPNALGGWDLRFLLTVALDHIGNGTSLDFSTRYTRDHFLTNRAPEQLVPTGVDAPPVDMEVIEQVIRELPAIVPTAFQQALISYWDEGVGGGASHWRWLSELLRSNLINTALTPSFNEAARCILQQVADYPDRLDRMVAMKSEAVRVYVIETTLTRAGASFTLLSPYLLVVNASSILLCQLSGDVESFTTQDAFDHYWEQKIQSAFLVDQITCKRYEPNGNVFEVQAAAVLNQQLEDLAAIALLSQQGLHELELQYEAVSDPAPLFVAPTPPTTVLPARMAAHLPDWLQGASDAQRQAYRTHLLELASAKHQAQGKSFLDGVDDIRTYAASALHRQMLIDQPIAPGYNPDELELAFDVAAGYPGGLGIIQRRTMSLTDLALSNLVGKPKGTMTVRHTGGQLIQDWTTPEYLIGLVQRVDIGKSYPEYLKGLLLSEGAEPLQRQRLFGEQLRAQLPLQALELSIRGQQGFTVQGYRYVAALMRLSDAERIVEGQRIVIRSLALLRQPGAQPDKVHNMFLIEAQDFQPGPVILYRPLYPQLLIQYSSREALLTAIAQPGALQDSVLMWLNETARPVYANGGFTEPHILRFGLGSEFDSLETPDPATLAADEGSEALLQNLRNNQLLPYLFGEHARALVDLADRDSVSNAESRWALLLEGGGILLNTLLLPLLQGSAMSIAWLLMLTQSLNQDIPALESNDPLARELAWIDLLSSLSLALMHANSSAVPRQSLIAANPRNTALALAPLRRPMGTLPVSVRRGAATVALPDVPIADGRTALDFAFSNALNHLSTSQRAHVESFKVPRPAALPMPIMTGPLQGLYRLEGGLHALVGNDLYRVSRESSRVFIVDALDPSRTGPWLKSNSSGRWTLDLAPKLRGGAPGDKIKEQQQKNRAAKRKMKAEQNRLDLETARVADVMTARFDNLKVQRGLYLSARKKLRNWWTLLEQNTDERKVAFLKKQHEDEQANCQALRQSLNSALEVFVSQATLLMDARRAVIKAIKPVEAALETSEFEKERSTEYGAISATQLLIHNQHLALAMDSEFSLRGESLGEITRRIDKQVVARTPEAYQDLITRLADISEWDEQLLQDTYALDATLNEHARDSARGLGESRAFVKSLPTQEMADPFNVVLNNLYLLRTLSIDRLKLTDAPYVHHFCQLLNEQNLRLATSSHIALRTYSHFSVSERKAVLTTLINQYGALARASGSLHELDPGLSRPLYQARFLERLDQARSSAESDLAQMIREEEGVALPTRALTLREPKRSTHRVFRTQKRGTLIGDVRAAQPDEPEAIMDIRDPFTQQRVASFIEHPTEGGWKELVVAGPVRPAPAPVRRSLANLKIAANQLMEQRTHIERSIHFQMKKLQDPTRREHVNPMDWDIMLTQQAGKLSGIIDEIEVAHAAKPGVVSLLDDYRTKVADMLEAAHDYCSKGYKAQRPTQENVDYLWTHRKVDINLVHRRELTASGDYVAEFAVREKNSPTVLWYAHFHYADMDALDSAYRVAHLKLASQRFLLQKDLVREAGASDEAVVKVIYASVTPPLDHKLFLSLLG